MNAVLALCHFCEQHGPRVMLCTQSFHRVLDAQLFYDSTRPVKLGKNSDLDMSQETPPSSPNHTCDACRSFPVEQPGIISHDPKSNVYYVSTQRPYEKNTFALVRQACLCSLSSEGAEGFEGPMVFGESPDLHVLSYQFFLDDSKARGKRRRFSLLAVMKDKYHLIQSWIFLVNNFKRIISSLQGRAKNVYSKEDSVLAKSDKNRAIDQARLLSRMERKMDEVARPLVTLINYKKVFHDLHQEFIYILKTGGMQWRERKVEWPLQGKPHSPVPDQPEVEVDLTDWETIDCDSSTPQTVLTYYELVEARSLFEKDPANGVPFRSLKQLFQAINPETFNTLAFHVIRGDQVIVRGLEKSTVVSILCLLAELLPPKCCKAVPYSNAYIESYRYSCNFLGLAVGVQLPDSLVSSSDYVILDVLPPLEDSLSPPVSTATTPISCLSGDSTRNDQLLMYKYIVNRTKSADSLDGSSTAQPALLQKYTSALATQTFSDALVDQFVSVTKQEWLDKAKVLYQVSKSGKLDGSSNKSEKLCQLLGVIKAGQQDLQVLRFWFSGITDEDRQQIYLSLS